MIQTIWRWIKKLTFLIWLIFMVILGFQLAIDNSALVSVSFFGMSLPETSLGLVVGVCLLVGVLMGFFTNYLVLKPGLLANKRALQKAKKEVASLRVGQQRE